MTNDAIATKYGSPGINDHMVLHRRVAFGICQAFIHAHGTKSNTLVKLYMVTYNAGFTNNNTGSVVNAEIFSYLCTRVYINTRFGMGKFSKYARKKWDIKIQ